MAKGKQNRLPFDRSETTMRNFFKHTKKLLTINKSEDIDLLNYMVANCMLVDAIEQTEIDCMNIDFDNINGKKLSLDEILQG